MKNVVTYIRHASHDSGSVNLFYQQEQIRKYCKKMGFQVQCEFREYESGIGLNRPQWNLMMDYINLSKHKIDFLVVRDINRLTRNMESLFTIISDFKKHEIGIHTMDGNLDLTRISSKSSLLNFFLSPEIGSIRKRDRARFSLNQEPSSGYFMGMAPIGYKNCKTKNGQYNLVIDTETAPLIKNILLDFSKGKESIEKIKRKYSIEVEKFNLNTQKIKYILQNPTYAGKLRIRNNLGSGYTYVKAKHIAIISNQTFTKNQTLLNKK